MSAPPNKSLLTLFLGDLRKHIPSIEQLVEAFSGKEQAEKIAREIRMLQGSSKIVQFDTLAKLMGQLESIFKNIPVGAHAITVEAKAVLGEIFTLLKEFAANNEIDISLAISNKQDVLQQLALSLKTVNFFSSDTLEDTHENIPEKDLGSEFMDIDLTMLDLFRLELETQSVVMNNGLITFEQSGGNLDEIEPLMRAAHSIKGAGRVVGLDVVVGLAHSMEDCFVAVQKQQIPLDEELIDLLLQGVDVFTKLSKVPQATVLGWLKHEKPRILKIQENLQSTLGGLKHTPKAEISPTEPEVLAPPKPVAVELIIEKPASESSPVTELKKEVSIERVLRVTAQNLNRLMGLAGESLVESRWLQPFSNSLLKLKKEHNELAIFLDQLRENLGKQKIADRTESYITELQRKVDECRQGLTDRLTELELFIVRHSSLSDRLYREVIDSRMRPFSDGVEGFPRMVRDLSRRLNKKVRLLVVGRNTPVDREILEKLEAPLGHLIRNAVDHGIESPEKRIALGKPAEGTITLEAQHKAGMLAITISDDGEGIKLDSIRQKVLEMNLVRGDMANALTETELLDFLFLPGFSTAKNVTDISGRGVGLNVVQTMIQEVAGSIRVTQSLHEGTTFHLQLPLTLSVIRALIVEIAGEPFAFPLARIDRSLTVGQADIEVIENRQYFSFEGQNIGLVTAAQVMAMDELRHNADFLPVIILSDRANTYGLVVDHFLGERELVVQELDHRLGKIQDISSGALMEDGAPVLIIDVEDLVRSVDNLLSGGRIHKLEYGKEKSQVRHKKRILVVDDSITVREVECRLLRNYGYEVETAVNGMDGWNAVRIGNYDLVVSDVDMPRMNGIELVKLIRGDLRLKDIPVLIVSYKEREEDRLRGMEAGANYYLTKSSFHDETLIVVVQDLIGAP